MWRIVRVEAFEELIELLDKIEVRIAERVPHVYDRKTHYIVKIDDGHRYIGPNQVG